MSEVIEKNTKIMYLKSFLSSMCISTDADLYHWRSLNNSDIVVQSSDHSAIPGYLIYHFVLQDGSIYVFKIKQMDYPAIRKAASERINTNQTCNFF